MALRSVIARPIGDDPGFLLTRGLGTFGGGPITLTADVGTFTVTGNPAGLSSLATVVLTADPGAFALTGNPLTLIAPVVLVADPGAYSIRGFPINGNAGAIIGRSLVRRINRHRNSH